MITDGDLRRALDIIDRPRFDLIASDIMTRQPKSISQYEMAVNAETKMLEHKINELLVLDGEKLVGVVQLFDTGNIL